MHDSNIKVMSASLPLVAPNLEVECVLYLVVPSHDVMNNKARVAK